MTPTPEYATIPQWCALSGLNRTATYLALSREQLRAVKLGRRTLVHVPSGLLWLNSLPAASVNIAAAKAA